MNRQRDYGWNKDKLKDYSKVLTVVHRYDDIQDTDSRAKIFNDDNLILFHESFFDNSENKQYRNSIEILDKLKRNEKVRTIFFGGSINSRSKDSLPASVLYQNLNYFLDNYIQSGVFNEKYLFFGKNPQIESCLIKLREEAIKTSITENNITINSNNLVIKPFEHFINGPFEGECYKEIYNKVEDKDLHSKVVEWFTQTEYENIFIPLCFGNILSDYNGLRLALHIRCTETPNQNKNIYIYSFVGIDHIIENEYFDILKTENVFLISYSKKDFENAVTKSTSLNQIASLSEELKKIKLVPPKNYEDNHSIANEWAIYRWAKAMNISSSKIEKLLHTVENNLYFKYLKTIYSFFPTGEIERSSLKFEHSKQPKLLYIDDEANKGWCEIFKNIFEINRINFHYLDSEFNYKSKEEIVSLCLKKIKDYNIDLVILDFRLHSDDFIETKIEQITGIQILKEIKNYNLGIQIIIFSATNKIWNLQEFQMFGADYFIPKESIENQIHKNYTKKNIHNFIGTLKQSVKMIFLREMYISLQKIKSNFTEIFNKSSSSKILSEIDSYLKISFNLLSNYRKDPIYLNYAFMQLFLIIELFISQKEIFVNEKNSYLTVGSHKINVQQEDKELFIQPIKFHYGKYVFGVYKNRADLSKNTNFKVSSLLIYRFGNINSSVHSWTNIYKTRNTKAAHYDKNKDDSKVSVMEISQIIDFIKYISDKKNVNLSNISRGLKEKKIEDSINDLISKYKKNTKQKPKD